MADSNATNLTQEDSKNNKNSPPPKPTEAPPKEISNEGDLNNEEEEDDDSMDLINNLMKLLQLGKHGQTGKQKSILGDDLTLEGVAKIITEGKVKNIIVMSGAGISVAAGIPDFRTPGTGLYDNLQKYNLPHPTAVFELDFFIDNPRPFYELARELFPGNFKPTPAHYFVRLLQEKGLLLCNFTQNVDTLERVAGVSDEYMVEAHGSFATARCTSCKKEYSVAWIKEIIFADELTIPRCTECKAWVKPDIVFFGESLPKRFFDRTQDFDKCDLLIVLGTSLQVQPFASLIDYPPATTPRLLINRELAGNFTTNKFYNTRDVIVLDDIQAGIHKFVKLLGWEKEFEELIQSPPVTLFTTPKTG
eukprot:TRINITY_DN8000_c0_g1_i1.p1 TRINITY_DN8000_c0_g1~~TRINITY_DN8000_c0_g1_i1.p1  ORF type:complete len:362 (+),score=86.35 TRINITY_DN8000_c0_g1_i1:13-1098(+)